jgi:glycosyltransferase involved in cell wall biosynthesis
MEDKVYPKVLIIGETFRSNGGGGITLINLFKEWPSDKLAIVTDRINETSPDSNAKFYQLGNLEKKLTFPFNLFKKVDISGEVELNSSNVVTIENNLKFKQLIKTFLRKIYNNILQFVGIYYFVNKISLSEKLIKWIEVFSPDIVYVQPFRYEDMEFANLLKDVTKLPMAIHVMDDSVSFLNKPNLFYFYWGKKIENSFRILVQSSIVHLSISQSMSDEYLKRYNKIFLPFRNPIEIDIWLPFTKTNWDIKEKIKIIYTGRLAVPNINSLYIFCKVVDRLNNLGHQIEFDIYPIDKNLKFSHKIKLLKGISINTAVPYRNIPELLSRYDITFLPIDFTRNGIKYAQFSISTKTSEYMISGVPILLFAPDNVALTYYAKKNNCMFSVSENSIVKLSETIIYMINNQKIREEIAQKAIETAKNDSSVKIVRNDFYNVLKSFQN